ncbi:MAG: hypothetical protein ABIP29_05215 [Candidatus Eisenbacteria bacterium]
MTRRHDPKTATRTLTLVPAATNPGLRPERIAQARARIREHYYDRGDVQRALAEALMVELAALEAR